MSKPRPYGFRADFERIVGAALCVSPRFWGAGGGRIDPERITDATAALAISAAQSVSRDLGRGPSSPAIVMQRLHTWCLDGRIAASKVSAVGDLLEETEVPPDADILAELVPVLKRDLREQAVRASVEDFGKSGDLSRTVKLAHEADALGRVDDDIGMTLAGHTFGEIEQMRLVDRLRLGVMELDHALDGGLPRGRLGLVMADSGGGKSLLLNQIAATALRDGLVVAYATLELPGPVIDARLISALTHVPTNDILKGTDSGRAKRELDALLPILGTFVRKKFTPRATNVADIRRWVEDIERTVGAPVSLVVVDYADDLVGTTRAGDKNNSPYLEMRAVFTELMDWAEVGARWIWTATQAKAPDEAATKGRGRKSFGTFDGADSAWKIRKASLVIGARLSDDNGEVTLDVPKNTLGASKFSVGPYPTDLTRGMLVAEVPTSAAFE